MSCALIEEFSLCYLTGIISISISQTDIPPPKYRRCRNINQSWVAELKKGLCCSNPENNHSDTSDGRPK